MASQLDADVFTTSIVTTSIVKAFQANNALADRAIAQVSDPLLRRSLDDNTHSIAIIMKHVAGNLISAWSAFLTTDSEEPDRNRDPEFIDTFQSHDELQSGDLGNDRAVILVNLMKRYDSVSPGAPNNWNERLHFRCYSFG